MAEETPVLPQLNFRHTDAKMPTAVRSPRATATATINSSLCFSLASRFFRWAYFHSAKGHKYN